MNAYEEVIKQIEAAEKEIKSDCSLIRFYYRGQADQSWPLIHSFARRKNKAETEADMMQEARRRGLWDDRRSLFDNLAHIQHYGGSIKTRFLDFSTERDIALYFACDDDSATGKNGKLFICPYTNDRTPNSSDSIVISEMAGLTEEVSLSDFCNKLLKQYPALKKHGDVKWLGCDVIAWLDHGFMVTPTDEEKKNIKEWNVRLFNQHGAFFVFANKSRRKASADDKKIMRSASTLDVCRYTILPEIAEIPETMTRPARNKTIIIPREQKAEILYSLDKKGINKAYVYPD